MSYYGKIAVLCLIFMLMTMTKRAPKPSHINKGRNQLADRQPSLQSKLELMRATSALHAVLFPFCVLVI